MPSKLPEQPGPLQSLDDWEDHLVARYPEPGTKGKDDYRNYDSPGRESVREFYRLDHRDQTLDFVRGKERKERALTARSTSRGEGGDCRTTGGGASRRGRGRRAGGVRMLLASSVVRDSVSARVRPDPPSAHGSLLCQERRCRLSMVRRSSPVSSRLRLTPTAVRRCDKASGTGR